MDKFETYLSQKRIDAQRFRQSLPTEHERLAQEFVAGGEKAFDLRKKFLLNNLRLEYPQADPNGT